MMKVLVLSHMYPNTANEVGGIFIQQQVKALEELGVDVKVVSPKPWTPFPINCLTEKWREYDKIPIQVTREGIQIYYPRYLTFPRKFSFHTSGTRMYWGIRGLVHRIKKDFGFDLIHAHVALPDGYAAYRLAQRFGKPFIVSIHGQDLQVTVNMGDTYIEKLDQVFQASAVVHVVSNKLKNIATEVLGYKSKIKVIPNGVKESLILQEKELNASTKLSDKSNTTLLSVSNLIPSKGIDLNIMAVSRLLGEFPSLNYKIVGEGAQFKELKGLAQKEGISDSVEFLGELSHDNVIGEMRKADIFALPSWKEGFGVVYLEAMSQAKPVVGCRGEGVEDFVEQKKTGLLVEPKDVDSLTWAIRYLMNNPDEASEMGKRARKVVRENYTWQKNAEKTISLYKEVLDG